GAEALVRRGAADLRRASADRVLRRAADLRGLLGARAERDADRRASAAAVAARGGRRRPLTRYLVRRLAFAVVLVAAVSSASFLLARLAPGDFVTESLGTQASREAIERERARFGLDRSIAAHYRDWAAATLRLDFGPSMLYGRPVRDLIPERAANTRSEEHTSELQSRGHLVCRLLLEKKKKRNIN